MRCLEAAESEAGDFSHSEVESPLALHALMGVADLLEALLDRALVGKPRADGDPQADLPVEGGGSGKDLPPRVDGDVQPLVHQVARVL